MPLKILSEKSICLLASGGGIGNIGLGPGTLGSLLALPLCYLLSKLGWLAAAMVVMAGAAFAIWIAGRAEQACNEKDPGSIVIDEMAGMLVTLYAVPISASSALLGFLAFRTFDIWKPYPIRLLDQRLEGGWGIVVDDLVAGVFANLTVRVLLGLVG